MAEIFVSVTVRQDRQARFQLENFKDSLGRPAVTDGGIQGIATESGAAEVVADTDAVTADVRKIADEPRA